MKCGDDLFRSGGFLIFHCACLVVISRLGLSTIMCTLCIVVLSYLNFVFHFLLLFSLLIICKTGGFFYEIGEGISFGKMYICINLQQ